MRAVLVFCEGKHDVAFVERSLGACGGCDRINLSIQELPSPFGACDSVPLGLIATRLKGFSVEDLTLHMELHPTPAFESVVRMPGDGMMFVLVSVSGKDQAQQALQLMRHVDATMMSDEFDVKEHAAAFLFDADEKGLVTTVEEFRHRYGAYFGGMEEAHHGQWTQTGTIPVGLYVFHGGSGGTGTVEHDLAPMVQAAWPRRYAAAERFVADHAEPGDAVLKSDGRRLKAVMTAAGQFDNPGRPLSTVIGRNGLPEAQYASSPACIALVNFLTATPWPSGNVLASNSARAPLGTASRR